MNWKKDLYQILVVVVILSLIEMMLQKGPYSVLEILISTATNAFAAYFLLLIIYHFIGSKPKNNKNEIT